jgi:hypothetical protein
MSDHMSMFTIIAAVAAAAVFGALAARFGAEQRPGFDERLESREPHHYGLR